MSFIHTIIFRIAPVLAIAIMATAKCMAQPSIKWIETEHDFGAFDEDMGDVTHDFMLVNTGNDPLTILAARATCGCTIPRYTREPVAPGDTVVISVTYNPAGRPGKFSKKVKVETNVPGSQSVLTINGVVIGAERTLRSQYPVEAGPLKLRNRVIPFGEVKHGRTRSVFLDGYNQSSDTIHPKIIGLPDYIMCDISPKAVPPGQQATFTLFYDGRNSTVWGIDTCMVTIIPDPSIEKSLPVSITAMVQEDFSLLTPEQLQHSPRAAIEPTQIDLGTIDHAGQIKATVTIDNFGDEPLIIRRVQSTDPAVTVKLNHDKVKHGSTAKLQIMIDTSLLPDDSDIINTRVTLITNDPQHPVTPIRIVGIFQ